MKHLIAILLIMSVCLSMLAGCGNAAVGTPDASTLTSETTEPTQPGEEGKRLKILTLGNSGALNCTHLLAHIAALEGYENFDVATLYYSGCSLAAHVNFLTQDASDYWLYESSTDTPNVVPSIMQSVSMKQALRYDYWDIVVMQGNSWEMAGNDANIRKNIQTIQNYIWENCKNPNAKIVWHMGWVAPTDNTLRDTYSADPAKNVYRTRYAPYNDDRNALYQAFVKSTQENVVPDEVFQYLIPTGTAMENALTSYLEEKDLHRDYYHATDLAYVMLSYVWLCRIFGIEQLSEIKLDKVPVAFFKSTKGSQDLVLTDTEKAIILESVNNALKDPFTVTQSQYTVAP